MAIDDGCKGESRKSRLASSTSELSDLLVDCLSDQPELGIAILDAQLRFVRINDALARMNGIPAEAHFGRTLGDVLGPAAARVVPKLKRVFATGEIVRFELAAKLPMRKEMGHWNETFLPIMNQRGIVTRAWAIVTEVTKRKELEESLLGLCRKLLTLNGVLKGNISEAIGDDRKEAGKASPPIPSAATLLGHCVSEIVTISKLTGSPVPDITPAVLLDYDRLMSSEVAAASRGMGDRPLLSSLSLRERQVFVSLANGKINKEIASALELSVRTIESHRARIMRKLAVHSISDLVRLAIRHGLIEI